MKMLKKSLLWLGFIAIVLLLISQTKILMFNDISVEPIAAEDNPDFKATETKHRPPVYLVSYASGTEVYLKNQNALALSSLNKGIDFILNYRPSLFDPAFTKKNAHILKHKTGAGYWIWKPYVILKTMRTAPEGSTIIYADTGFVLRGSLKPILDRLQEADIILYKYNPAIEGLLKRVTKRYALVQTNCDTDTCRNAPHILAGFMVLRNTPTARAFIEKWLQYCEDETLIMESPNLSPEDPDFSHHQHDEALLSIVHYQQPKGVLALPPENFPFLSWHHRKADEYKTLLPRMKKHIMGIEQRFLNSALMIKLREFFLTRYFTNHFEAKKPRKD